MPQQTYTLSPDKFTAYMAQLPQEGFVVVDDAGSTPIYSGTITGVSGLGKGIVTKFTYDGATLTVTGVDKPFFCYTWEHIFQIIGEHLQ